ncbi:PREDICTED: dynein assembly factor 1, axonemal-like [Priapulus caudatus]|uniref:Dynein assembly factor 1, axonemal-like n=1 Tax=Priapulus caudatus TaxID=37621 RepID=A0ABM1FAP7_PRICU|nr:PREDICTED: dynein assembly factor 1, axonemal-like [Priapulus caudatus]
MKNNESLQESCENLCQDYVGEAAVLLEFPELNDVNDKHAHTGYSSLLEDWTSCNLPSTKVLNSVNTEKLLNKDNIDTNKMCSDLIVDIVDSLDVTSASNDGFVSKKNEPLTEHLAMKNDNATGDSCNVKPLVMQDQSKKENSEEKIKENVNCNNKNESDKLPRMTKEFLKRLCKQNKLYLTPYLNDTLYLHFKGFGKIENLDEYTGLKCIWLESNGIRKIENLEHQTQLRCLYMHQNLVDQIENLEPLQNLVTINLSHNYITKLQNLSCLPNLETLQMSHNRLQTSDNIAHLLDCHALRILDLSHNRLDDVKVMDVFGDMTMLRVLNIMGNSVKSSIQNYRKMFTLRIKQLQYLDDQPVFPRDRACAEAWEKGGREAESMERQRWINKERGKIQASVDALADMRYKARARREREQEQPLNIESGVTLVDQEGLETSEDERASEVTSDDSDTSDGSETSEDSLMSEEAVTSEKAATSEELVTSEKAVTSDEAVMSEKAVTPEEAALPEPVLLNCNKTTSDVKGIFSSRRKEDAGASIGQLLISKAVEKTLHEEDVFTTDVPDDSSIDTLTLNTPVDASLKVSTVLESSVSKVEGQLKGLEGLQSTYFTLNRCQRSKVTREIALKFNFC